MSSCYRYNTLLSSSLRQGVPGAQAGRAGCGQAVRPEAAQESVHRTEDKDHRAYAHREAGSGSHQGVTLPGYAALRLPNRQQTQPDPG